LKSTVNFSSFGIHKNLDGFSCRTLHGWLLYTAAKEEEFAETFLPHFHSYILLVAWIQFVLEGNYNVFSVLYSTIDSELGNPQ